MATIGVSAIMIYFGFRVLRDDYRSGSYRYFAGKILFGKGRYANSALKPNTDKAITAVHANISRNGFAPTLVNS